VALLAREPEAERGDPGNERLVVPAMAREACVEALLEDEAERLAQRAYAP